MWHSSTNDPLWWCHLLQQCSTSYQKKISLLKQKITTHAHARTRTCTTLTHRHTGLLSWVKPGCILATSPWYRRVCPFSSFLPSFPQISSRWERKITTLEPFWTGDFLQALQCPLVQWPWASDRKRKQQLEADLEWRCCTMDDVWFNKRAETDPCRVCVFVCKCVRVSCNTSFVRWPPSITTTIGTQDMVAIVTCANRKQAKLAKGAV